MNHAVKQQGFTLVELVLAMAFIGALLLAIAMTVIQIGAIYNQGTTLREINQVSRDISDDLRRTMASAGVVNLDTDFVQRPLTGEAMGGRLCLGSHSYIWNYGKAIATNNAMLTKYDNPPTGTAPTQPIRFVRVPDSGGDYCKKNGADVTYKNIRGFDVAQAQELLKAGDHELGVHKFSILPVPASARNDAINQSLYSIQFSVGTSKISALNADQSACLLVSESNFADPLYCNVQYFMLVLRARE